jgi:hypothetical protein
MTLFRVILWFYRCPASARFARLLAQFCAQFLPWWVQPRASRAACTRMFAANNTSFVPFTTTQLWSMLEHHPRKSFWRQQRTLMHGQIAARCHARLDSRVVSGPCSEPAVDLMRAVIVAHRQTEALLLRANAHRHKKEPYTAICGYESKRSAYDPSITLPSFIFSV